jgi:hypothetical protein
MTNDQLMSLMNAVIRDARAVLTSSHQSYEFDHGPGTYDTGTYTGGYKTGVADGHRCAANMVRDSLAALDAAIAANTLNDSDPVLRHGALTFRQLLTRLSEFTSEELDDTATIQLEDGDEFIGITAIGRSRKGDPADGILDHGHRYLVPMFGQEEAR